MSQMRIWAMIAVAHARITAIALMATVRLSTRAGRDAKCAACKSGAIEGAMGSASPVEGVERSWTVGFCILYSSVGSTPWLFFEEQRRWPIVHGHLMHQTV